MHDTKPKYQFSHKLDFRWIGPYRIADLVRDKRTYFFEELNSTQLQGIFAGNQLKFFHVRKSMNSSTNHATNGQGTTIEDGKENVQAHIPGEKNMAVVIPSRRHDQIETVEVEEADTPNSRQ